MLGHVWLHFHACGCRLRSTGHIFLSTFFPSTCLSCYLFGAQPLFDWGFREFWWQLTSLVSLTFALVSDSPSFLSRYYLTAFSIYSLSGQHFYIFFVSEVVWPDQTKLSFWTSLEQFVSAFPCVNVFWSPNVLPSDTSIRKSGERLLEGPLQRNCGLNVCALLPMATSDSCIDFNFIQTCLEA